MLDHVLGEDILEGFVRHWISIGGIEINLFAGGFDVCIQPTHRLVTACAKLQLSNRVRFEVVADRFRPLDPTISLDHNLRDTVTDFRPVDLTIRSDHHLRDTINSTVSTNRCLQIAGYK